MKKYFIRHISLIIFFPLWSIISASGAAIISQHLYTSLFERNLIEVDEIHFVGNNNISDIELSDIISQKQNMKGLRHRLLDNYYNEFRRNPMTPPLLLNSTADALMDLKYELRFFNKQTSDNDTLAIKEFYNINGFHNSSVSYSFLPDSISRKNILTYYINEGPRYKIRAVPLYIVGVLPPEIESEARSRFKVRIGSFYRESKIIEALNNVKSYLLDNGYYFTKFIPSNVYKDSATHTDSLAVFAFPGIRQKIGHINIIDSAHGQKLVVSELKQRLLTFKEGDWYSQKAKSVTEENFFTLGMFNVVLIDTTSEFYPMNDSTLNIKILLNYIKLRNWAISPFINQTAKDEYWNAGVDASIGFKNIFGAAQNMRFFGNVQVRDLSSLITKGTFNLEGQAGINFSQPILWTMDNARVGGSGSLIYSLQNIDTNFIIQTVSFPISFPVTLTNDTYFDRVSIDFLIERQNPLNFDKVLSDQKVSQDTSEQYARYYQAFHIYEVLDNYLKSESPMHWFTTNLISLTLTGDSRNNPFSPTAGQFTSLTIDTWDVFLAHPLISGIARFSRVNFIYTDFSTIDKNFVNAFKAHFGLIYKFDANNSYVPYDRQFYAGGANSVRGWQARQLHYSSVNDSLLNGSNWYRFFSNILGSGTILEGSYELRYKFSRPSGWDRMLAEQIENIGFTWFVDVGETYDWYVESADQKSHLSFFEYFTKLAWATGIGLRYDTPIGPIRIDFALPIYRPYPDNTFNGAFKLWDVPGGISYYQIHIGIGNAF